MQNFNDTMNKTIKFKMSLRSFNNSNTKHRCENITKVYIKYKYNITVQIFYYNISFLHDKPLYFEFLKSITS